MNEAIEVKGFKFKSLFSDQYGDPYAAFEYKGVQVVGPIRGKKFKGYVRDCAYETVGIILCEKEIDELVEHCAALAYLRKTQHTLQVRVARAENRDILVDGINCAYGINANGWGQVVPPIIFRQTPGMKEFPTPTPGGDLRKILNFINLKDSDDHLLLLTSIVAAFVPDIAHPVLALHGPQGSGKSTFLRMLVRLLDPCVSEDVHFTEERDFLISVANRWVVPLDNISRIKESTSDLICKFVTESSFSRRRLYTDDDEYMRTFRRVVILNGINLPVYKPDLLDRCLILNLERITSTSRRDEASIWAEFNALRPELLGACFDILSRAQALVPTIQLAGKPRLADFAIWACAIGRVLGYTDDDFIRAYGKNVDRQTEEALDASPLASLLLCYFREDRTPPNRILNGTPTAVLRALRAVAPEAGIDDRNLPRSARGLTNALKEIQSNLESRGFNIERTRGKERSITIYPPNKISVASVPSLPSLNNGVVLPSKETAI